MTNEDKIIASGKKAADIWFDSLQLDEGQVSFSDDTERKLKKIIYSEKKSKKILYGFEIIAATIIIFLIVSYSINSHIVPKNDTIKPTQMGEIELVPEVKANVLAELQRSMNEKKDLSLWTTDCYGNEYKIVYDAGKTVLLYEKMINSGDSTEAIILADKHRIELEDVDFKDVLNLSTVDNNTLDILCASKNGGYIVYRYVAHKLKARFEGRAFAYDKDGRLVYVSSNDGTENIIDEDGMTIFVLSEGLTFKSGILFTDEYWAFMANDSKMNDYIFISYYKGGIESYISDGDKWYPHEQDK